MKLRIGPQAQQLTTNACLAMILLLAACLRFYHLDMSLWEDELLMRERAAGDLVRLVSGHPYPLYYILAHFSLYLADTEAVLRLPSVAAGLLSVAVIYLVGRSCHGRVCGLIAALLLATSAYHIRYCQEARFYALVMLAGLVFLWLLFRCLALGRFWNWFGYVFACLLGLLSHVCVIPYLAVMVLMGLVWLVFHKGSLSRKERLSRGLALVLCTVLGSTSVVAAFTVSGFQVTKTVNALRDKDGGEQVEPSNGDAGNRARSVRLTPSGYLSFFKEFFPLRPKELGYVLTVLGICGLGYLLVRRLLLGLLAVSVICFVPLPLFFVTASHFYASRYFSIAFPVGLLLISVGMVVFARFPATVLLAGKSLRLGERRGDETGGSSWGWADALSVLLLMFIAGTLAPPIAASLASQYREAPYRDWKNLVGYMARSLTPSDVIYCLAPAGRAERVRYPLYLSLQHDLHQSEAFLFSLHQRWKGGFPTPDELLSVIRNHPSSTLWFVKRDDIGVPDDTLEGVGATKRTFHGLSLWVLGEPTTNLIEDGGFESPGKHPTRYYRKNSRELAGSDEAYEGQHCLKLTAVEPCDRLVYLSVRGATYRLSNAGFEVWDDGVPVGWGVSAEAKDCVAAASDSHTGNFSLELRAPATLRQRIPIGTAPGATVEVRAFGKATAEKQVGLVLSYTRPGAIVQRTAYHPGNGSWEPMVVRAEILPDADPETISIELFRSAGKEGTARFDHVTVGAANPGNRLDPAKTYTLSMMVKYAGLASPETDALHTVGAAKVLVAYLGSDGKTHWQLLCALSGSSDWRQLVFPLKPGTNLPRDARNLKVVVGIVGSVGTLWLDNVQLEPTDHPTPFTDGSRIPHDELIAELAPAG